MNNVTKHTKDMVLTAIFAAIIMIMTFVPQLGYINLPLIKATLLHVPVILGSILLGWKRGAFLGFIFGFTSLIVNTFSPSALSFAFSPFYELGGIGGNGFSLIICFVPRILVGIVPYFVYTGLVHLIKNVAKQKSGAGFHIGETAALAVAGVAGALVNTLLVMHMIYLFFRPEFAAIKGVSPSAVYGLVLGVIATNGVMEAIVGGVLAASVGKVLLAVKRRIS